MALGRFIGIRIHWAQKSARLGMDAIHVQVKWDEMWYLTGFPEWAGTSVTKTGDDEAPTARGWRMRKAEQVRSWSSVSLQH